MPKRISSSLGLGFSCSRRYPRVIMPGVQKPHCRPCISRKPSCSACSVPSAAAIPSMVRRLPPSACTAKSVQDFTDLPSRSTVQAPQWLVSQPICGPVKLSCSRRKWMRRVRGSTSPSTALPLTVIVTCVFAISCVSLPSGGARLGARQRPRHHHARHLGAVLGGPAIVGGRRGDRLGGSHRLLDRGGIERRADDRRRRVLRPERRLPDIGERNGAGGDAPLALRQDHRRRRGRVVADLALQLLIGGAVAGRRHGDADGGDHLAGLERRSEEHTSELQSLAYLVCRLLLEKKNNTGRYYHRIVDNLINAHID